MNISGRLLLELTCSLRRSSSLALLRSISSEPHQSKQLILERQFQQIARLLSIAEAHVPYYRELFRSLGVHARDIRNLHDFSLLPVLTKDIVREKGADLVREDVPKSKLITQHTGGSTGVPVKFYVTRRELDLCEAGMFRSFQQAGWKPGQMIAFFWGDRRRYSMPKWTFEVRQRLRRMYQFDAFHSGPDQMDEWIRTWRRVQPRIIFGYSSVISRFAEHLDRTGQKVAPVLGVFSTAEKLYDNKRKLISRVFCCQVYDMYGSSEINNIACTCSQGSMHINSDSALIETDRSGIFPEQPPAFIATSLRNEVMPFIRYQIQDCGEFLDGTCGCGNMFPLMKLEISRVFDHFILPNGRFIHGMLFTRMMDVVEGVSTFQFHQTAADRITLWIVPAGSDTIRRERSVQKVVEQLKNLYPGIEVQVRATNAIPTSPNGKHQYIRSDVRTSPTCLSECG